MITKDHVSLVLPVAGLVSLCIACVATGAEEGEAKSAGNAPLDQLVGIPASRFTKVIDNSTSPDKRLAVALGSRDGKPPKWDVMGDENDDGVKIGTYYLEDCRNYVINLKTDRVTGILDGEHFGTRNRYNHESGTVTWSPDSRWLAEHQQWKWHTGTCTVHRLDAEGRLAESLDFLKSAKGIVDEWLRENSPKMTEKQRGRYVTSASVESISDDGKLSAWVSAEIPKADDSEYLDLTVTAKVDQGENGDLTLGTLKVKSREE